MQIFVVHPLIVICLPTLIFCKVSLNQKLCAFQVGLAMIHYMWILFLFSDDPRGFKIGWNSTYICPIHRQRFVKKLRIRAGNCSLLLFKSHWKGLRKFQPSCISYLCQILPSWPSSCWRITSPKARGCYLAGRCWTPSIGSESVKSPGSAADDVESSKLPAM